jgi:hypothetical protein
MTSGSWSGGSECLLRCQRKNRPASGSSAPRIAAAEGRRTIKRAANNGHSSVRFLSIVSSLESIKNVFVPVFRIHTKDTAATGAAAARAAAFRRTPVQHSAEHGQARSWVLAVTSPSEAVQHALFSGRRYSEYRPAAAASATHASLRRCAVQSSV